MKDISFMEIIGGLTSDPVIGSKAAEKPDGSFAGTLENAMDQASLLQKDAEKAVVELAAGEEKDIHKTMIALEKAEVSLQLMMQVRNKIVAAYEEIMRMQV